MQRLRAHVMVALETAMTDRVKPAYDTRPATQVHRSALEAVVSTEASYTCDSAMSEPDPGFDTTAIQGDLEQRSGYRPYVAALRQFFRHHRLLAVWLILAALLMKMLVPTGYMASPSAGSITIELCSGFGPQKMVAAMPGMAHHQEAPEGGHGKAEQPCAFAGLSVPSLAATDPVILALAIAFIVAMAFRAVAARFVMAPAFLRPPLRGPPTAS